MSRPATAVSLSAPKATSVITNQAVVRNALSKPRSKKNSKKESLGTNNNNSNNNTTSKNPSSTPKRKGYSQNSASSVTNGNLNADRTSSRPSTPLRNQPIQTENSKSDSSISDMSTNKNSDSRKSHVKSNSVSANVSENSESHLMETPKAPLSIRRSKNPSKDSRSSPKKKNLNNSTYTNLPNGPASLESNSLSSIGLHQNSSSVSPKKKKQNGNTNNSSAPNNSSYPSNLPTAPSRTRRNKKPPTGVTLRVEPGQEQRDLKEILFPDLFAGNKDNKGNQRKKGDKRGSGLSRDGSAQSSSQNLAGTLNKNSFSSSEPTFSCFAGSSFSNTPDPSALPKPMLFGKTSPKSRNSLLHELEEVSSSPDSATDGSSSPSSPTDLKSKPIEKALTASEKPLSSMNNSSSDSQTESDVSQQDKQPSSQQQSAQFAQQPSYNAGPMNYSPYGMVSSFPIPQNTNMAPMAGPIIYGAPGMNSPYYYGNEGGYLMSYPNSVNAPATTNVAQNGSLSAPPTSQMPLNKNADNMPNSDLANDLKRLLNVV